MSVCPEIWKTLTPPLSRAGQGPTVWLAMSVIGFRHALTGAWQWPVPFPAIAGASGVPVR